MLRRTQHFVSAISFWKDEATDPYHAVRIDLFAKPQFWEFQYPNPPGMPNSSWASFQALSSAMTQSLSILV
jgi:hypothetical protein